MGVRRPRTHQEPLGWIDLAVGHDRLRPEAAHQLDLLLEATATVVEVHPERLVLDGIPPEPDAEPEVAACENVDLGGLLREQSRLALRCDYDAGDQLEPRRDRRDVAEDDEDLVEHAVRVVRAAEAGVALTVGAEHVVVRVQVLESEVLYSLGIRADAARVGADLRLREDRPELQRPTREPPTIASRPSARRTQALPLPS